ncbi:hypothetical protein PHMEG_00010096 [Phytophthora megakarya]|uniref:Secreted protein n=1 Tax=Phytophthora megakarya TaxID=4795 RepID=A0A225WEJ4_9STRA|nr:hypothetical protein PHMEG_00010096 [Phytophthora megakarya]
MATTSVRFVWSLIRVCSACSSASRFSSTTRSRPTLPASSGRLASAPLLLPGTAGWDTSVSSISLPTSLMLAPSTSRSSMLQIWWAPVRAKDSALEYHVAVGGSAVVGSGGRL